MPRIPTISGIMTGSRGKPTTRTAGPQGVVTAHLSTNGGGSIIVSLTTTDYSQTPMVTISVQTHRYNGLLYHGVLGGIEDNMPPFDETKAACKTKEIMRDTLIYLARDGLNLRQVELIRRALGVPTSEQIPRRQ